MGVAGYTTSTCPECRQDDLIGYIERGSFDGILVWVCVECGHVWPRFGPEHERLHAAGLRLVKAVEDPEE